MAPKKRPQKKKSTKKSNVKKSNAGYVAVKGPTRYIVFAQGVVPCVNSTGRQSRDKRII